MDIADIPPREQSGRDTITRFRVQYKAAAIHCLKLLDSEEIQCVYCDYQDDFAVELKVGDKTVYEFYQVKTKADEKPIALLTLFGIKKAKRDSTTPKNISDSYAGKLLLHTINFGDECALVCLLTNAFFDEDIKSIRDDIESDAFVVELTKRLISHLPTFLSPRKPLSPDDVKQSLRKLKLESGLAHLNPDEANPYFVPYAQNAITQYSEIELKPKESLKIIENLCTMVQRKSAGKLKDSISRENLKREASVDLNDVLGVLSISARAYEILKKGGEKGAIKTTSILSRVLQASGFTEDQIEVCAECKVKYDDWYRQHRHNINAPDMLKFQHQLATEFIDLWKNSIQMPAMNKTVNKIWGGITGYSFHETLSENHIFGGLLSELVRKES